MATVGLLSFSDGRKFAHEIVRPETFWPPSERCERLLEARRARGGRRGRARVEQPATPFARRAACAPSIPTASSSTSPPGRFPTSPCSPRPRSRSPLILMSNLDPARPGLVGDARGSRRPRPGGAAVRARVGRRRRRRGARPPRGADRGGGRGQRASRDDLRTHRRTPDGDVHGHGGHRHLARPLRHRRRGDRPVRARPASGGGRSPPRRSRGGCGSRRTAEPFTTTASSSPRSCSSASSACTSLCAT